PLKRVNVGMMLGKASKIAQGQVQTHSKQRPPNNISFLMRLAEKAGYPPQKIQEIRSLHLNRQLKSIFPFQQHEPFYLAFLKSIYSVCRPLIHKTLPLRLFLLADDKKPLIFP
ncbi:MAG: hypothetical protein OXB93_01580, partial [Cytophagales bacterium]|nr:hypothetical protein [Cytophagales bacterium]